MRRPGRLVFGLAIAGFGTVGLLDVDFPRALQPIPTWMPGYEALALVNGAALLVAGTPRVACRVGGSCACLDAPRGLMSARGGITRLFVAVGMCGAAWLIADGGDSLAAPMDVTAPDAAE